MSQIAAIILAAGASKRLGQPKQLVRYQGQTLLARTIAAAREAGCEPIIAVLGANAEACRTEAAGTQIVLNEEWQTGMASSVRVGLQAAPEADAALLLVCDQPHLSSTHLGALLALWREQPASIISSNYGEKMGVPALFPRAFFPQLIALRGDEGARNLLRQQSLPVLAIPWAGGALDLDQPSDLDHLR